MLWLSMVVAENKYNEMVNKIYSFFFLLLLLFSTQVTQLISFPFLSFFFSFLFTGNKKIFDNM
jgi:hypothetical protein